MPAVMVGERLLNAEQFARRSAIIGCRSGVLGRPLEQHRIVRAIGAAGFEIAGGGSVDDIRPNVELPVTRSAAPVELGMEGEALNAALGALRLYADTRIGRIRVEIFGYGLAIVAHAVQRSAHFVHETPARP